MLYYNIAVSEAVVVGQESAGQISVGWFPGLVGSRRRRVAVALASMVAAGPAVAADPAGPSADTPAFVSDRSGRDELPARDLASGAERRITDYAAPDRARSRSPDGRRPPHQQPEADIGRRLAA